MKILGISAKKQGGKNSSANYLNGLVLKREGVIHDFNMLESGELNVLTEFEDGSRDWGILDLYRKDSEFLSAAENRIFPYVKNYSFADSLKELAVNLFELNHESVYGTDAQKMEPIHLRWENMPGVVTNEALFNELHGSLCENTKVECEDKNFRLIYHSPGPMTGREFLQFLGTEIGRRMYPSVWVNATINKIVTEQSGLAIVTDVRFPDEVQAIKDAGGIVLRLDRRMFEDDHPSEIALDEPGYDWDNFHGVIRNQGLTLLESCKLVEEFARHYRLI